jgi:hypothetical protein
VLVGIHGVWICCGYSVAGWVGYGCFYYTTAFQWRFPLSLQCLPPVLLLIGLWFIPESPRWRKIPLNTLREISQYNTNGLSVCLRDRHDDAYRAIEYLHGDPSDPQQRRAKREYEAVQKQLELDRVKGSGSYKELFTNPANRKRVTIGFLLLFGAQCTATIVIANYGVILYTGLGYTAPTTLAFTAGWVTVAAAGNTISALFVDRVGRVRFLRQFLSLST